jgi:hypothetical protein
MTALDAINRRMGRDTIFWPNGRIVALKYSLG